MGFNNSNAAGVGVQVDLINGGTVRRCSFFGGLCGYLQGGVNRTNVDVSVDDCTSYGDPVHFPNSVGFWIIGNNTNCYTLRSSNHGKAGAILANSVSVYGGHSEVSTVGVELGLQPVVKIDPTTGAYSLTSVGFGWSGTLDSYHCEACLKGFHGQAGSSGTFNSCSFQGELQPFPGQSQNAVDNVGGNFSKLGIQGTYSTACVNLGAGTPATFLTSRNIKNNPIMGVSAPTWVVPGDNGTTQLVQWINCGTLAP